MPSSNPQGGLSSPTGWDWMWERFIAALEAEIETLRAEYPSLAARWGHYSTPTFPFRGWAVLGLGEADELLDLSVDAISKDNSIDITADLARTDGVVLADAPGWRVAGEDDAALVGDVAEGLERFVRDQHSVIVAELKSRPGL